MVDQSLFVGAGYQSLIAVSGVMSRFADIGWLSSPPDSYLLDEIGKSALVEHRFLRCPVDHCEHRKVSAGTQPAPLSTIAIPV